MYRVLYEYYIVFHKDRDTMQSNGNNTYHTLSIRKITFICYSGSWSLSDILIIFHVYDVVKC